MKLFKKRRPAIAKFDPYQTALQQSMESDRQEVLEKTATGPIFTLMGVPYIFDPAQGVLCKAGRRRAPSPGQLGLFGGHNEGDTKVEDGVTYRLNANSRWERMDKPKASGKRKPKPAIVPVVEAEKLMPEVVDDAPKPTRLGDRIRAIANDLRDENDEQKKIAARILGAAAQMAQNYDNLVGEVVDMVGEDLGEDIRSLNPDATQADVEMAARDGGNEPSPTRLADKMKAIANDLRNETNEQVKATARILDAAAQIAQNYDNLVDEVAEMVGEDLRKPLDSTLTKSLPPSPVFTLMGVPYIFDPHRAVLRKAGTSWEQFVADLSKEADDDPCWEGYEAVGMKKKRGKMVPNCVPVSR
jgi:hypothetical protein